MIRSVPEVRVRLLHVWATYLRFPMTEEQAAILATGDQSEIRANNPLDITIGAPICERCEMWYIEAPYSCTGDVSP